MPGSLPPFSLLPLPPSLHQELRLHSRAILFTLAGLMTCTFSFLFLTMLTFTQVTGMFRELPGYGRIAVYAPVRPQLPRSFSGFFLKAFSI